MMRRHFKILSWKMRKVSLYVDKTKYLDVNVKVPAQIVFMFTLRYGTRVYKSLINFQCNR